MPTYKPPCVIWALSFAAKYLEFWSQAFSEDSGLNLMRPLILVSADSRKKERHNLLAKSAWRARSDSKWR